MIVSGGPPTVSPTVQNSTQSGGAAVPPRVQKPKGRRNGSTATPATVQMGLNRLDRAALAHQVPGFTQNASGSSSNVPSLVSSSSSTPPTSAIDGGPIKRTDSSRPSFEMKDEERHGLQPTSSEPASVRPPCDSCVPKAPAPNDAAGQIHQDAFQNGLPHASPLHQTASDGRPLDFGPDLSGFMSHPTASYDQFDAPLDLFDFSDLGRSTDGQISRHINTCGEQSDCDCGDGCMCLGCIQHPTNDTTQRHVQDAWNSQYDAYASNSQHTGLPAQPDCSQASFSENPYMNGVPWNTAPVPNPQQLQFSPTLHNFLGAPQYDKSQASFQQMMSSAAGASQPYGFQYSMAPPANNNILSQRPAYQDRSDAQSALTGPSYATDSTQLLTSILDAEPATNHEYPSTDEDDHESILSSSGFQIEHLQMPGCNDITGSCLCGDGCACPGCVIHSGHAADHRLTNTTSAGAINGHGNQLNTLSNASDMQPFIAGFDPNIQHSMTPASIPDEFFEHMQSSMSPTTTKSG